MQRAERKTKHIWLQTDPSDFSVIWESKTEKDIRLSFTLAQNVNILANKTECLSFIWLRLQSYTHNPGITTHEFKGPYFWVAMLRI